MGGDGGSIPLRQDLVKKSKAKNEVLDPDVLQRIRWTSCALSKLQLQPPLVVDELGNVFNKEAIVRALIDKQIPEEFRHIRSLKDVFAVQFSPNDKRKPGDDSEASQWMCPISFVEIGHLPFSAMRKCGCVVAARAIREVATAEAASTTTMSTATMPMTTSATTPALAPTDASTSANRCPHCATAFDDATRDVVPLNVANDVYQAARTKLLEKIETERREKASRKAAATAATTTTTTTTTTTSTNVSSSSSSNLTKRKADAATAKLTSAEATMDTNKRVKTVPSVVAQLAAAKVDAAEKRSDVYKSLFNKSHEEQRETFACRSISGRYF